VPWWPPRRLCRSPAILLIADDERLAEERARPDGWASAVIGAVDRPLFANATLSQDWRGELLLAPLVRQIASGAYGPAQPEQAIPLTTEHDLGYAVFGPLLLAFLAWLFDSVARRDAAGCCLPHARVFPARCL
jgi:hypothetical protein